MMNTSTNDYDLIERFFDFDLSEAELQAFEKRLTTDTVFNKRFQLFQEMDQHIEAEIGITEALKPVKQVLKSETQAKTVRLKPQKGRVKNIRRILSIAAGVALLAVSIFVVRSILTPIDSGSLAMDYWNKTEKITFNNLRSDNALSTSEQLLLEASTLFEQQDYIETIQKLAGISSSDPQYSKASLLLGQAYFNQNEMDKAEQQFQVVLNHPSKEYQSSALWFQALTQLAKGDKTTSLVHLKEIIDQNYPLAEKAKELLAELE